MMLTYRTLDESRRPCPKRPLYAVHVPDSMRKAMGLNGNGSVPDDGARPASSGKPDQARQTLTAVGALITLLNLAGG